MSLYGINAYTSNYSSLYSGLYNSNKNKSASASDLLELAKKVDKVRSSSFKKSSLEEFKKAFESSSESSSSESALKLSQNANNLSRYAGALATKGTDFSDPEKTLSSVKNFVESYNKTLDGIQDSDSTNILEKGVSLVNTTKAYSRTLARVGIYVGNDNRLTVDETLLKNAPEGTLKSLFSGSYSYATKVADKASYVGRASTIQSQFSYNSKGGYDFYNQLVSNLFENKI